MLTTPNLTPLQNKLNERYDGRLNGLLKHLDEAMYMLYFLEEDAFSSNEVRNVVYALKNLKEGFQEVQSSTESGNAIPSDYTYFVVEQFDEDQTTYQELNLFL